MFERTSGEYHIYGSVPAMILSLQQAGFYVERDGPFFRVYDEREQVMTVPFGLPVLPNFEQATEKYPRQI